MLSMLFGMGFPHLIFLIIYFLNDLLTVYLATYVQIPLGYTEASFSSFYELKIFIKEFFEFSPILYFSIISIIYFISKGVLINIKDKKLEQTFDFLNQLLFSSLLFYFIGSHNYYCDHPIFPRTFRNGNWVAHHREVKIPYLWSGTKKERLSQFIKILITSSNKTYIPRENS